MEFPLWRLKPEDAARLIILEPLRAVERHKFWHKREMRIRPSRRSAPRMEDVRTLDKAKWAGYWDAYQDEYHDEFPVGVLHGPLLANHQFSGVKYIPEWDEKYSAAAFEEDVAYFEAARWRNWHNFILGQEGKRPYLDSLICIHIDRLLLTEIDHCKAKRKAVLAALANKRLAKLKDRPKKAEHWQDIGTNEATAFAFKHSGYTVRKVGLRNYEVLIG